MIRSIECAGHPRDMGLAQGGALGAAIRAAVARAGLETRRSRWPSLRAVVSGPLRGQGAGRELFRHFAHQAERLEGLAEAAALPLDALLELQLRMRRPLEAEARPEPLAGFVVRASRPVVGFRSLELTLPWLVPALAGVNDAGLAVVAEWPPLGTERGGGRDPREGDAPPILLVQDCLARFENVAGAVDWCRKRPVEGELVLRLLDASGTGARVVVSGRERQVESLAAPSAGAEPILDGRFVAGGGTASGCRVWLEPRARRFRCEAEGPGGGSSRFEEALPAHAETEASPD